jgi:hypothetical protein
VVRGAGVAPRPENIFAAFNATPLSAVRVVVLGAAPATGAVELDSPLHNGARVTVPLAQGLAWSVPVGAPVPPAVLNVHAELAASYRDWAPPTPLHGSLERGTRQGVLLLATALAAPGEATAWGGIHGRRGARHQRAVRGRGVPAVRRRGGAEGAADSTPAPRSRDRAAPVRARLCVVRLLCGGERRAGAAGPSGPALASVGVARE